LDDEHQGDARDEQRHGEDLGGVGHAAKVK
jgi:hypothetical protein